MEARTNPADEMIRTNVVLSNRNISVLDRVCADARGVTGVVLDRSQVLRVIIDAFTARNINAGMIGSEDDLRRLVA